MKVWHQDATPEVLAIVRIGVFATMLLEVLISPLHWLGDLPADWFGPWGVTTLVPDYVYSMLLSPPGLLAIHWSLVIVCIINILGIRPHGFWAILACALLFFV